MSFDTNRFTQKSQEAIVAAQNLAERNGNSNRAEELTPCAGRSGIAMRFMFRILTPDS